MNSFAHGPGRITAVAFIMAMMASCLHAQDGNSGVFKVNPDIRRNFYTGIEYSELAQNGWTFDKENFTFLFGQRFHSNGLRHFGWRVQFINVDLSKAHIQDEASVRFIEGDRSNLEGDFLSHRLYFNYYPITIGIKYLEKWDRYILKISPVTGIGLGYGSWGFYETAADESYRLNALLLSVPLWLHTEILDVIFIDNPFMDFFTYLAKNRSVAGSVGDVIIHRPEFFGISAWATVGVKIRF